MKKIALLLLFAVSFGYSQTTIEEYNYITKGYKETISKGLDVKQGYSFQDVYQYDDPLYTFDFKLFVNNKTKKNSCIMVLAYSKMWSNTYYLCIPVANPELTKLYERDLNLWDKAILSSYSLALSNIFSLSLNE